MVAGYIALGLLSLVYYCFLVWYTRRVNSTFSWFWLLLGVWNVIVAVLVDIFPDWGDYTILAIQLCVLLVYVLVETLIFCAMVALPHKNLDYIIVLGAQIRGTTISGTLKRRLDRALAYMEKNEETVCIVTGGQGKGEAVSEAKAMADYLIGCGIDEERVLLENQSTSTYENLMNTYDLLEISDSERVGIVTNNFHMYRATKYAKWIGYKKVYSIVASCDVVLFLNYMTREFFAVLMMFSKFKNKNK